MEWQHVPVWDNGTVSQFSLFAGAGERSLDHTPAKGSRSNRPSTVSQILSGEESFAHRKTKHKRQKKRKINKTEVFTGLTMARGHVLRLCLCIKWCHTAIPLSRKGICN